MKSNGISGKVIVITGASSGLGEAAARLLAAEGGIKSFYEKYAIPAESFARIVAFAISQPAEVDVNEILFRPTNQEL